MGLRDQAVKPTLGGVTGRSGTNAQCCSTLAPEATQRLRTSFWAALRTVFVDGGGMTLPGSLEKTLATSWLSLGLPGTTTGSSASTVTSRRNLALRVFSSGPWHL